MMITHIHMHGGVPSGAYLTAMMGTLDSAELPDQDTYLTRLHYMQSV
jgi:hypothetical protein